MALPIFLHPSTKLQEIDLTQRLDVIVGTLASVTAEFERGPIGPRYQRGDVQSFKNLYGLRANPAVSFGHDTVTSYMSQSGNILVNRFVKNALHSGTTVYHDRVANRIGFAPFEQGTADGYAGPGIGQFLLLSVVGEFRTGNTFTMNVTDGVTVRDVNVTYTTDHNSTMELIADTIETRLSTLVVGASVSTVPNLSAPNAPRQAIIIRVPPTAVLDFLSPATTGTGKPDVTLNANARLVDVYAENPGEWSDNKLGVRLTNIDPGVRERYRFVMSRAFESGNTINLTVNGTVVSQAFVTDSDTTLAALAAKLTNHPDIYTAEVETVTGGVSNDRSILIIAAKPGPAAVAFQTEGAISGGANPGVIAVTTVMTGVRAEGTFYLEVYSRENTSAPISRYEVSLPQQLNRLGYQLNVTSVVNQSSRRSDEIRIAQNPATLLNYSLYAANGDAPILPTTIAWLSGGDDGVKATSGDVRQALRLVQDRRKYPMNLILNAGYTAVSVQKEIAAICEKRSDCMGILDAPSDRQQAQVLREHRLNELDIDSSYVAMYTPDVEIEDIDTGERRYIPPSGVIGATYAYSDRLTNNVGAPAGLNRGKTPLALGLRYNYSEEEMDLIYPVGINYIEDRAGVGSVVMAEETLQFKKSVMSSVHARRIMNTIKTALVDGLDYTLFDPNTESTRFRAVQLGETILAPMKRGDGSGGLYDYRIKCDGQNNDGTVIDSDQLAYAVFLKIVRVIKGVGIKAILTPTGAQFDEYITEAL